MSGVEGVQGFLRGSWLQRSNESKVLTISRVLGFQGPRVNGSQGLYSFNGYQRSTGFRVSRDSGFPMLSRAFKGVGIPIINVSTLFQEFAGLKGHMTSRVLKIKGSRGLEG